MCGRGRLFVWEGGREGGGGRRKEDSLGCFLFGFADAESRNWADAPAASKFKWIRAGKWRHFPRFYDPGADSWKIHLASVTSVMPRLSSSFI